MSNTSLESWAVPRLAKLLPLDDESLKQVVLYSSSLSRDESAEHLRNLLDDSPAALEFISAFNSRRGQQERQGDSGGGARASSGGGVPKKKTITKPPRGSLHSPPATRQPEGYGDTSGGYVKAQKEENYIAGGSSGGRGAFGGASTRSSPRNQSPAPPSTKNRMPPSASGPMISEYLPNVRTKKAPKSFGSTSAVVAPSTGSNVTQQKNSGRSTPTSTKTTTTTNNIADITSAIAALEILSTNSTGTPGRKCNCNTSIHPLFTPAPNCTSCGKIICALEGIQPCSFCGSPILSSDEVEDMIRELKSERGNEKMRVHNDSFRRGNQGPTALGEGTEVESKFNAAKAHRDKLLSFQAHNAQRTRILDEAADFEMPTSSSTQWMTPAQRALALKKQQRMLRELEEQNKPEWEKKSVVMSLEVKKGKIIKTFGRSQKPKAEEPRVDSEVEEVEDSTVEAPELSVGQGTFSNNPLLQGAGLVRPTWKPPGEDGDDLPLRRRAQKQSWRRVQDDDDDNERWILDGGLHGFDRGSEPEQCG